MASVLVHAGRIAIQGLEHHDIGTDVEPVLENYHQLRRAVAYANFGRLRFKSEEEQQIWSECSRLLTNCILYFNATMLSELLAQKLASGDTAGRRLVEGQHGHSFLEGGSWS